MESRVEVAPQAVTRVSTPGVTSAVKVGERLSRRAVKQAVDAVEAEVRAVEVAAQLVEWYNRVGLMMLEACATGEWAAHPHSRHDTDRSRPRDGDV